MAHRKKWTVGATVVGALLLVALVIPITTTDVPVWRVRVVDESGHPLKGAEVARTWSTYPSYSETERRCTSLTDQNGEAAVPAVVRTLTLGTRMKGILINLDQGVHASWGVSTTLTVSDSGRESVKLLSIITEHTNLFDAMNAGKQIELRLLPVGAGVSR